MENIGDVVCGKLEIWSMENSGNLVRKTLELGVWNTLEIWCVENIGVWKILDMWIIENTGNLECLQYRQGRDPSTCVWVTEGPMPWQVAGHNSPSGGHPMAKWLV